MIVGFVLADRFNTSWPTIAAYGTVSKPTNKADQLYAPDRPPEKPQSQKSRIVISKVGGPTMSIPEEVCMRIASLAMLVALASTALFAESPFDGTWALNQEKSKMVGQTLTIEDAGKGETKFVNPNFSTTVKSDGTKTKTSAGGLMAFEKRDDQNYHQTTWIKDKELSQVEWKLSDGSKTLTTEEHGTRPNGERFNNTTTYTRISGTKGLSGTWKATALKMSSPPTYRMKITGDQFEWNIPEIKGTLKGKTDGKDTHPTGPTVPESLTLAVSKQGPRTLTVTQRLQGKTVFTGTYSVSEDGKRMTVDGTNAKGEPVKQIWDKQGS
jgi:hypothetical protein